ncbi:MAG: adenine phosphoribosyltransferase [Elusimicrobiota bacterium]
MDLEKLIRNVPDFPKDGVQFKDITTLIKNRDAFKESIDWMCSNYKNKKVDKVLAVESRGFIFGAPVALQLNAGLILVRKEGKLPAESLRVKYELEYGEDVLEMHKDALEPKDNVIIVDDLLATGGTTEATIELVEKVPANILGLSFLIELEGINGRKRLEPYRVDSLIKYPGE